tara:strand:+ start:238 stop:456 length:219 start_codon:yes stop_codon:yes gene_type:complete
MKVFTDLENTTPDEVFEVVQQCIVAAASWHVRQNSSAPWLDQHWLNELLHFARNKGYDVPPLYFDEPEEVTA